MIHKPHVDWFALAPVNALLAAAALALLAAVLAPRRARKAAAASFAAAGFAVAFAFAAWVYARSGHGHGVVADAFRRDRWAALAELIVAGSGLLAVPIAYAERTREEHAADFFAVLAAAGAGMCFFAGANNLMTIFLSLEWFSLALYVMCAIEYDLANALEAGLKYLVVGSFGSAILLFGSALVYGATGKLSLDGIGAAHGLTHDPLLVAGLAMVVVGFSYKASAAPFHQWTPDVYEGAPTPVTAFMSAATKTVALVVAFRVLRTAFPHEAHLWTVTLAVVATASLALGNLAALVQRNLKRMLAYSSISHAGFMLMAIAANTALGGRALLYYLIPYSAMSLGAFAVVAARERELLQPVTLDNLAGLGWERPFLGAAMSIFMLGFIGMPVSGGFIGKIYVFAAAYDRGWSWLIVVGAVATAVSLYYYLGVIRAMYMRSGAELQLAPTGVAGGSPPRDALLHVAVFASLVVTIGSLFAAQPLIDLARHAAGVLF